MVLKAADFPRWCRVGYLNSALHFTPPPPQDPIPGRRQFWVGFPIPHFSYDCGSSICSDNDGEYNGMTIEHRASCSSFDINYFCRYLEHSPHVNIEIKPLLPGTYTRIIHVKNWQPHQMRRISHFPGIYILEINFNRKDRKMLNMRKHLQDHALFSSEINGPPPCQSKKTELNSGVGQVDRPKLRECRLE